MKTVTTNFRRTVDIPNDWGIFSLDEIKLNEHNSFVDGPFGSCLKTLDYTTSGIPVIQLNNIGIGEFIPNKMNFTSEEKFDELKRAQIFPGEIVIAKMADPVARCCIVPNTYEKYLISADCIKLKVDKEKFSPEFIANLINSNAIMSLTFSFATGTTRLRINLTDLKKIRIPCPLIKIEQEKIAKILSEIEKLIINQKKLIDYQKDVKKSLMKKLFSEGIKNEKTHEIQLGRKFIKTDVPKTWNLKKLREVATVHGRIGWKNLRADEYIESGPLMLSVWSLDEQQINGVDYTKGTNHLSQFRYEESPEIQLQNNDILITKDGDIGRIGYVNKLKEPTTVNSHVVVVRIFDKNIDPEFLYYYFQHESFQKYCVAFTSGTTVPLLSQEKLKEAILPIPIDFDEQLKIKSIIKNIANLVFKESQYLENIIKIKRGLMQQLLSGQERVKI